MQTAKYYMADEFQVPGLKTVAKYFTTGQGNSNPGISGRCIIIINCHRHCCADDVTLLNSDML